MKNIFDCNELLLTVNDHETIVTFNHTFKVNWTRYKSIDVNQSNEVAVAERYKCNIRHLVLKIPLIETSLKTVAFHLTVNGPINIVSTSMSLLMTYSSVVSESDASISFADFLVSTTVVN